MKEYVKEMFEGITMPEETEQKIRMVMAEDREPERKYSGSLRRIAAAAAVFVLIFALSPTARAAVNNIVVKFFFPGSDITVYEETDENGDTVSIVVVDTEAPAFARIVNGRLYFLGNGEKIDITDQIAEEEPYFYTYKDDYDLTHYMAVGYSGSIENFGIYEFIREEKEGQKDWEGWVTGTGRNFLNPETETRYPWVDIVWAKLNVPWPMPE